MKDPNTSLTRREFLKLGAIGSSSAVLTPWSKLLDQRRSKMRRSLLALENFPDYARLGRVVSASAEIKAQPDATSATVRTIYENAVFPWIREKVGNYPFRFVQRYVETPDGYIWAPHLQMVANRQQDAITQLPDFGSETPGMWVEVTVPYVDLVLDNPPVRSRAFQNGVPQKLYYEQVVWVDEIKQDDDDNIWYRINERFGSYGDIFWAPAKAFRMITPEEIAPINPEAEEKHIVINTLEDVQTLSCFEGNTEVFFCRCSVGQRADATGKLLDRSATPLGTHPTFWKLFSIHMSGGASGVGWDLMGVAWATFFATPGIAIHSTFWHNNFGGEYMSHGCVNVRPQDAKWIFRWTQPYVAYDQGEVTVQMPGGTTVQVVEINT